MKDLLLRLSNYIKKNWLKVLVISLIVVTGLLLSIPQLPRLWISIKSFARNFWFNLTYRYEPGEKIIYPPQTIDDLIKSSSSGHIIEFFLPIEWDLFVERLGLFFLAVINPDILRYYGYDVLYVFYIISRILTIAIYASLILYMIFQMQHYVENSMATDSWSLRKYKGVRAKIYPHYKKVKGWIKDNLLVDSFKRVFLLLLLLDFGLIPLILDTFSEILIFFSGFNLIILWNYIVVAASDIVRFLLSTSPILYIPVLLILINKRRKKYALKKLRRQDKVNEEFYDSTGNVIFITGASGTGKTTMLVDAVLTLEMSLRNKKLLKIMNSNMDLFPNFQWRKLESRINYLSSIGTIRDKRTIQEFVDDLYQDFSRQDDPKKQAEVLFNYEIDMYPIKAWNGLIISTIWKAIYEYSCAYFFYVITSPLSMTATAISHNMGIENQGKDDDNPQYYFPIYDPDYFEEDAKDFEKRIKSNENNSMIMNYDYFRPGKKMAKGAEPYLMEVGIWAIPEAGKELGASNDVRMASDYDEECNFSNDLFYFYQTIARHNTELSHEVLHKLILDDQDIMKVNSDTRNLIETTLIIDRNACRNGLNALPFFFIEELLFKSILKIFHNADTRRKARKRKDTLIWYIFRNLATKLGTIYTRHYNQYGYDEIHYYSQNSSLDDAGGGTDKGKLYRSYKKLYSQTFDDVYLSTMLRTYQKASTKDIRKFERYKSVTPESKELLVQNSHLVKNYFSVFTTGKKFNTKNKY